MLFLNVLFSQKVNELACSLYDSGTNLSRSASSVGEHQSVTYVLPTLPKRAETFGGFDNSLSSPKSKHNKTYTSTITNLIIHLFVFRYYKKITKSY